MDEAELGPGANHFAGQPIQPSEQCSYLTAQQHLWGVVFDQARCPLEILRDQCVVHRVARPSMLLVPGTRSPVKLRHELGLCLLQALAQQVGEEMVVPIPAPLLVQGHDEQIALIELL